MIFGKHCVSASRVTCIFPLDRLAKVHKQSDNTDQFLRIFDFITVAIGATTNFTVSYFGGGKPLERFDSAHTDVTI